MAKTEAAKCTSHTHGSQHGVAAPHSWILWMNVCNSLTKCLTSHNGGWQTRTHTACKHMQNMPGMLTAAGCQPHQHHQFHMQKDTGYGREGEREITGLTYYLCRKAHAIFNS